MTMMLRVHHLRSSKWMITRAPPPHLRSSSTPWRRCFAAQKSPSIEQIYQKKTQLEHILLRPDTYIGSIESITQSMWVYHPESKRFVFRPVSYVPGLYKIFDEILVNAADNKQRDLSMNRLQVDINPSTNEISVWNNGQGIPIVYHREHQMYVPELIFGHLLTGSNFNDHDAQKKMTGGRNGYGAKLANIFSTRFSIDTQNDGTRYRQVFSNNMTCTAPPEITSSCSKSSEDYTCITFQPDLDKFNMQHFDDDILALFQKRVIDLAGICQPLDVVLNHEPVNVQNFQDYVRLYQNTSESEPIFEKTTAKNNRWKIGCAVSDEGYQQVSFVNSICTIKGGQHVNYITDQIVSRVLQHTKRRSKDSEIKPSYIKNHLSVFVSAMIENPAFDSQTKETLTTRVSSFGSKPVLSEAFLKQIEKSGLVDRIVHFAKYREEAELRQRLNAKGNSASQNGQKSKHLMGITKLDDANFAGMPNKECTLILTEGDSAKALAISGLSVIGRDYYGVFPLKGKFLNVREASHRMILQNVEVQHLVSILGLEFGKVYTDTSALRYSKLMIMADQDHDGSHIKGLVINFIQYFWPSLFQQNGFMNEFITPIVKASRGRDQVSFYSLPEFHAWKSLHEERELKKWTTKYYKGLGTSSAQEAKAYFSDLPTHQIRFHYHSPSDGSTKDPDTDAIDMAFSKKRVEDRKEWLRAHDPEPRGQDGAKIAPTNDDDDDSTGEILPKAMSYETFVNQELILFSMADNVRSIPHVLDGLKPTQRKILFACFKRNLKQEMKVAQLAGYVAEHAAYHHGEMSLTSTIINMAQTFVGSNNNIHFLTPSGMFGSRLMGGKDAASARYVFTKLQPITRALFHPLDDALYERCTDDGQDIEPKYYIPILPMVLINGSEGIGTGWSTSIPNYNPLDVLENIRRLLRAQNEEDPMDLQPMEPWYRGFQGKLTEQPSTLGGKKYRTTGVMEQLNATTIVITELPIKTWISSYKVHLENLLNERVIRDFRENHTDTRVEFRLTFPKGALARISRHHPGGLFKLLKLQSSFSTGNMHCFNAQGQLVKYHSPHEILREYFPARLALYEQRRLALMTQLRLEREILEEKVWFIQHVISGKLSIANESREAIEHQLESLPFPQTSPNLRSRRHTRSSLDHLLSMKLWNLTSERVATLELELESKSNQLEALEQTSAKTLWLQDLDTLEPILLKEND